MKIPVFILFFLFCSVISLAQIERRSSPAKQTDSVGNDAAVNKMDKSSRKDMLKELDLTREQKSKLKEIHLANKAKKETIENNGQLSETEKKSRLRDLQKEQAQSVQAILTDEQKDKFKSSRQKGMKENN